MQELICLVHFYITTLTLQYSLRVQGGGYSPLAPPLNPPLMTVHGLLLNTL